MGHLAVTDGAGGTFSAFERFSRGAVGLAGAVASPFRVWLEDWELRGPRGESGGIFPLSLNAREDGTGLSLTVVPSKPLVLQGEEGLSQKGPEPGNASYYYSFTRLDSEGWLFFGGDSVAVEGSAWMDREWSTSALSPGQVGWDWFALQLSDGSDLMYYQLRNRDGTADPYSKGVLVDPEGNALPLDPSNILLEVLDDWESPVDGVRYPSRWNLSVPSQAVNLEVVPLISDQELNLTFRYWEGAVRVSGTRDGAPVQGRGYVELTGYTGSPGQAQPGIVPRNQLPR
jgi:predicted secreted hydrolase